MGAPENYYAAPNEGPALPTPRELPGSFAAKFALALELYFGNFPVIAAVILTVWLPVNLFTKVLLSGGGRSADPLNVQFNNLTEVIFGPIVAGAIIWIIRQRAAGNPARYGEAMRAGLRSWGAIFAARFVAGLFIVVGLIALIIPGIRFMVHYALVDQVAAVENPGYSRSRSRSAELVKGQFWQVLLVVALTFSLGLLIAVAVDVLESLDASGLLRTPVGNLTVACVINLVSEIPTCLMTVYYLEAVSRESRDETPQAESQAPHPWATPVEIEPFEPL